ncbi:MAG TPA: hypothetical protein VFB16_00180 [Bauldia sp.]|nr:hypothetical protein [Bauldia sp.]
MKTPKNPADIRPFRSKAEHENEEALEAKYRRLAIPEVVAALHHLDRRPEPRFVREG